MHSDIVLALTYKEILGIISVVLTIMGYSAYLISTATGKTRPHVFSWLIWGIINGVIFAGQYIDGAGAGSWVTGMTSVLCFVIIILGLRQGDKYITRSDWLALGGALATIPIWYVTKDPLSAVLLATLIDVLGCYPTIRKLWHQPQNENLFMWSTTSARSLISIFALENYTLTTTVFPIAMVFTNGGIALLVLWRRHIQKTLK